jgi:hypothetical protein
MLEKDLSYISVLLSAVVAEGKINGITECSQCLWVEGYEKNDWSVHNHKYTESSLMSPGGYY